MTFQTNTYQLENIQIERIPDLNRDSNLLMDFEVGIQNPITISFYNTLYVVAKSSSFAPPAIVVVGPQTNNDIVEILPEIAQLDVWPERGYYYLSYNNNLLLDIIVNNQDNYLDSIPTIFDATGAGGLSGPQPFWS